MSLFSALTTAILPVLSIAAVGYILGSVREIDVDALGTVTLYVLIPALIFHSLATTSLAGSTAVLVIVSVVLFTLAMVGIVEIGGRLLGEGEPALSALVLSSVFPNAGNYGIPLSEFAFGPVGRSTAVLFIAGQAIMMYTVGVYIASRGQGLTRDAVGRVFRIPLIYAVVVAFLARFIGVVPPTDSTVMRTIELVGEASIPIMLLMLGIQLANTSSGVPIRRVLTANVFKLAVAPIIGLGIVLAIGRLESTVARVFVLECGMPAAVTPLILAIEFDDPGESTAELSRPEYISTAVLTTTLISIPTLTVLIALLQAGVIV